MATWKKVIVSGSSNVKLADVEVDGTVQFGSLSDGTISGVTFVDEDNMASDSATRVPTQQSVKAYVDANAKRTVGVDTNGNGVANTELLASEDLVLTKGNNITLTENAGVVTIAATATVRTIKANDGEGTTETLGNDEALEIKAGSNISLSEAAGVVELSSTDTNTFRGVSVDSNGDGSANFTLGASETLVLKKGSNISLSETGGVVTISSTDTDTQLTQEQVEDFVDGVMTAGEGIDITYDDTAGTLTVAGEDASTTNKGIASFSTNDFSVSSGAVTIKSSGVSNTQLAGAIAVSKLATQGAKTIIGNAASTSEAPSALSKAQVLTLLNVEDGADVTDAANVKTALGGAMASNTLQIGDSNTTTTIPGNLTVNGTTTTVNTTNLEVKDQFINLNDGGSAADGGFVVEGDGVSFGWDSSAARWGYLSTGATNSQTAPSNDAFAAQVVTGDTVAAYRKNGNIRVESNEIYIYIE